MLDRAKLTSAFGARKHPVTGEFGWHNGIDLAEEMGKPVYAPADGSVYFAGERDGYGNLVGLALGTETTMRFGQLSEILVNEGDTVKAGDVIGKLGRSGRATGPHLHFEVWHGDKPYDPQKEEGLVLADELRVMPNSAAWEKMEMPIHMDADSFEDPTHGSIDTAALACQKLADGVQSMPRPERWAGRLAEARAANAATGIALNDTDLEAMHVQFPKPSYPQAAIDNKTSGACIVLIDIDVNGKAENADAHCSDPMFDASAEALPGATFKVREVNGQPVAVKGALYPLQYCIG